MDVTIIPCVQVFVHREDDLVLLVHRAVTIDTDGFHRGSLPFGTEEQFSIADFERQAVSRIQASFIQYPDRVGVPDSEVGSFSKKKWLRLLREHWSVGVSLQEAGHWHLSPFYHTRAGRYRGSDQLIWFPHTPPEIFFRRFWMAVGRAELKKNKKPNQPPDPTRSARGSS